MGKGKKKGGGGGKKKAAALELSQEEAREELLALEAIYGEDLAVHEEGLGFSLHVTPHPGEAAANHVSCQLSVRWAQFEHWGHNLRGRELVTVHGSMACNVVLTFQQLSSCQCVCCCCCCCCCCCTCQAVVPLSACTGLISKAPWLPSHCPQLPGRLPL